MKKNKAIADFDNKAKWVPYSNNNSYNIEFETYNSCMEWIRLTLGNETKYKPRVTRADYHKDYNSLMRVVEQILKMKFQDGDSYSISTFQFKDGEWMFRFSRHSLFVGDNMIDVVYKAVLDVVEYQNFISKGDKKLGPLDLYKGVIGG